MSAPTVDTVPDETVPTEPAEGNTADNTEATEPSFDVSTLDEFGQQYVARTSATIESLNSKIKERKEKSTDPREIADSLYDTLKSGNLPGDLSAESGITDKVLEQYNKAEEIVAKIVAKFREVADAEGKRRAEQSVNAEEVAALDTEIEALTKKAKRARDYLSLEYPGAEAALPDIARGRGAGTSGGTGKGAGGRKLRGFTVTIDNVVAVLSNAEGKKVSSFAAGAKTLGIPTADLQRAYMAAAGTEDAEQFPDSQSLTVKGADDKDHEVVITRNKD